ncbi:MAG: O-antigen ligase family protein [Patescibacteria group bacterium]|nr:O-antigen ligase family protein [Patescibacteria group bacterium]
MLFLGIYGSLPFFVGLALYALGLATAWKGSLPAHLRRLAGLQAGLLLLNFTFYASVPLLPLVDLSLALYFVLLAGSSLLVFRLRAITGEQLFLPLRFLALAFLILISLSGISASHRKEVLYFVGMAAAGLACWYLVLNALRGDFRGVLWILRTAFWLGALSSLAAVWQLYSESFKVFYFPYLDVRDQAIMQLWELVSRVVGTWQHPSYLGMYLAMMLPVGVYLLFQDSRAGRLEKILVWLGLVAIGAVLLLTNTRSSALAGSLGAGLVFVFAVFGQGLKSEGQRFGARFAVLGLAVAAGILLYQFVFVSEIYSKPQASRVDASATIWGRFLRTDSMSTESLVQRSELYKLAWQEFVSHPLTGIGAKNFSYAVEEKFGQGTDAHNVFLQFLAETGILGTLSFVALFLGLLWSMFWRLLYPADPELRLLRLVLFVELLLVLFDSQFNNPLFSLRLVGVFWILIGAFYALPKHEIQNYKSEILNKSQSDSKS